MSTDIGPKSLEIQLADMLRDMSKGRPLSSPQRRAQVIKEISTDLRNSFLKCTVLPYGLDEIGISEDTTCLYLSVDTYGKVDVTSKTLHGSMILNSASYSAIAQQIFKILTANSSTYQFISIKSLTVFSNTAFGSLMPTPLPEISFIHKSNAKCKIRLDNYLSVQKTRLLNLYSRLDVRFWPLIMLVRHWGTQFRALRSADALDFQNYAISLLLVYFLVSKKIIPSLQELQSLRDSGVDKPFLVDNYDLSFCSNVSVVKPTVAGSNPALQDKELRTLSIISILKGFFTFCSTFDFKTNVICPYLGMTFKREMFRIKSEWKNFPDEFSPYFIGADGNSRIEKLYLIGPICVQDIFELTTNITRPVTEDQLASFTKHCAHAVSILENVLNQTGTAVLADAFTE